jgi:hypothetical protein
MFPRRHLQRTSLKEVPSGGLSAARFRHPAGLNGYRVAAPPLLRLCRRHPCLPHQVVLLRRGAAGQSRSLVVDLEWRKTKDFIDILILFQGRPCCNFLPFEGFSVIVFQ